MCAVAPRVRMLSGELVDPAIFAGVRCFGQARASIADHLHVELWRVRLLDAATGQLLTDESALWQDMQADRELSLIVKQESALQLPKGRLQDLHGLARRHATECGASSVLELEPIGDKPHTPFRVVPLAAMLGLPAAIEGLIAKDTPVQELRAALAKVLEVPFSAVGLSYEGSSLDDALTLKENGIPELGVMARKAGTRVPLTLALPADVLPGSLSRAVSEQVMRQGDVEFQTFAARFTHSADGPASWQEGPTIGLAAPPPQRWLTSPEPGESQCYVADAELKAAIQQLVDATSSDHNQASGTPGPRRIQVEVAMRNESRPVWDRYSATRDSLAKLSITPRTARTTQLIAGPLAAAVGDLRPEVNEFLLFRGIEPTEAGCLRNDVEVPASGFRFWECGREAAAAAGWERIGDVHGRIHTMLLCRVLCGNRLETEGEELRAMLQGPASLRDQLAAASGVHHSVSHRGRCRIDHGRAATVVFDLNQVYPEFLLLFRQVGGGA